MMVVCVFVCYVAISGVVSTRPRGYTGIMDAFKTIVKEEGLLGLYKGTMDALDGWMDGWMIAWWMDGWIDA